MNYQTRTSSEFENDLLGLAKVDDAIGNAVKQMATQARITDLENQVSALKKDKEDLETELNKVSDKLHQVFGSMRYRLGNVFIRPIELVLRKK
jgi:archaellum component FlaC